MLELPTLAVKVLARCFHWALCVLRLYSKCMLLRHALGLIGWAHGSEVHAGPLMDGASVYNLLESQQCNTTAAVPTVWLGLLQYMRDNNLRLSSLKSCVIGGSAAPLSMIKAFQEGASFCTS